MTTEELMDVLCPPRGYPMDADAASHLIVDTLLADLPSDRKETVRDVIWEWASQREFAVSGTVSESTHR
jgi:hypothetical protein